MSEFKDDLSQPNMMKCTPSFSSNCSRPLIEQTDEEICRAEFEKNIDIQCPKYRGIYMDAITQSAWESWQDCWKLCGGMKDE